MNSENYNLPKQENSRELKINQFFLVVSASGDIFKTKFKPEFNEVRKWRGVVFSDIVSNNQSLFYEIGQKEFSCKIKNMKVSDAFSKDNCFHFTEFPHTGHTIKKCWIETTISGRLKL